MQDDNRDTKFDPWRSTLTAPANALVAEIVNELVNYQRQKGLRKNAMRATDLATLNTCVSAIVANLIRQEICSPRAPLFLSLSNQVLGKKSRYGAPAESQMLRSIVDHLSSPELRWLEFNKGVWTSSGTHFRSTIAPTSRLRSRMQQYSLGLDDLTRDAGEEIILLKSGKEDYWDTSDLIDYTDTAETIAQRAEVDRINDYLAAADLDFDDDEAPGKVVDVGDRILRRYFNRTLTEGGRLYGGWWQPLKKAKRKAGIIIQGEQTLTLDFGQMGLRLLYGMAGVQPPSTDLYTIPGLEQHRAGVKKLISALSFTSKPLKQYPKETLQMMPSGLKVQEAVAMIAQHHPAVAPYFGQEIGFKVFYLESEILIDILLELIDLDVSALPVHDAIIIPASKAEIARSIMLDVFHQNTGTTGVVDVEGGSPSGSITYKGQLGGLPIVGEQIPSVEASV